MMQLPEYVKQIQKERRLLAVAHEQLKHSHLVQKQKAEYLEEENRALRRKIAQLEKDQRSLQEELEKTKAE